MAWIGVVAGLSAPLWVPVAWITPFMGFCGGLIAAGIGGSVFNNWALKVQK
jgi:hypothetical protein